MRRTGSFQKFISFLLVALLLMTVLPTAAFGIYVPYEEPGQSKPAEPPAEEQAAAPAPEETQPEKKPAEDRAEGPAKAAETGEEMPEKVRLALAALEPEAVEKKPFSRDENIRAIVKYLREKMGLNDYAIAGVLANLDRESSFDHRKLGDANKSYGICQWNNVRWDAMINFCCERNLDWTSLDAQLAFMEFELQDLFDAMYKHKLKECPENEEGATKAAYYFCASYEAPLDLENELNKRIEMVKEDYLPLMKALREEEAAQAPAEQEAAEQAEAEEAG